MPLTTIPAGPRETARPEVIRELDPLTLVTERILQAGGGTDPATLEFLLAAWYRTGAERFERLFRRCLNQAPDALVRDMSSKSAARDLPGLAVVCLHAYQAAGEDAWRDAATEALNAAIAGHYQKICVNPAASDTAEGATDPSDPVRNADLAVMLLEFGTALEWTAYRDTALAMVDGLANSSIWAGAAAGTPEDRVSATEAYFAAYAATGEAAYLRLGEDLLTGFPNLSPAAAVPLRCRQARLLLRLQAVAGGRWGEAAKAILAALTAEPIEPAAMGSYGLAVQTAALGQVLVGVYGPPGHPGVAALLAAAGKVYAPNKVVQVLGSSAGFPLALVRTGRYCSAPVYGAEGLQAAIRRLVRLPAD